MGTHWHEYRVIAGDGKPYADWIVCGGDETDALATAKRQYERGGGNGLGISGVQLLLDCCDHCGIRHREPPSHLDPESYCR